ncbi:hypothetical protein C0995_012017 [Termitomyces sp. Mi166|nr:hypothetical protein C0995_012017 [Termitomyces sp. Mi166\
MVAEVAQQWALVPAQTPEVASLVLCIFLHAQYALAQLCAASSSSQFGQEALQEQRWLSYPAGKLPLQGQVVLLTPGTVTAPHSLAAHMAHAPVSMVVVATLVALPHSHKLPLHQSPLSNRATGKEVAPHAPDMPHSQHMGVAIRSPVDFVVGLVATLIEFVVGLAATLSTAVKDPV